MSGTFSSLSSALSALRYNRVAMDVAGGNVANAATAGYARRQVVAQATGAPSTPAVWSRWDGAGDGVEAGTVQRMVDPLLDARARAEHAASSFLSARSASLVRFETTLREPGDSGIAAALAQFQAGWHDVANNPADGAARSQLLARAGTLQGAIRGQADSVRTEWDYQRDQITALADEVNRTASDLATLNDGLRDADLAGTDAGTLLDRRDELTTRLAELTGARLTVNPDTTATVTVGGETLVQGTLLAGPPPVPPYTSALTVGGASILDEAAGTPPSPVTVSVGGVAVDLGARCGEIGGAQSLLDGDLPDYLAGLDGFVATMVSAVNAQHRQGADLAGNPGTDFFTGTTAGSLAVAVGDPDKVAAASLALVDLSDPASPQGLYDGSNADALGNMPVGAAQYRSLVTSFGVAVASARTVADNQDLLTSQVDAARESVSGISVDEEMVSLLAAQRGYEGASRVLTTLDSVLDTLINRTGVTR